MSPFPSLHRYYSCFQFWLLFSWFQLTESATSAKTLAPYTVKALKGAKSDQSVAVLAKKEQSGTQNTWSTYIELDASDDLIIKAQFDFKGVTPKTSSDQIHALTFQLNSMGLDYLEQKRIYKIKRQTDNKWVTIGDNRKAPSWSWFTQSVSIANPKQYYNDSGNGPAFSIQIISSNKVDVFDVDYLVLDVTFAETPSEAKWLPKASDDLTWQYQLQGTVDTTVDVDVFDIDLFEAINNGMVIPKLHKKGKKVICYFSAGSYESWRTDWSEFFPFIEPGVDYAGSKPPFANPMADWAGERWLDVSRIDLLEPIMTSRMQLAAAAGCDAVEPDNMDAYANAVEAGLPNLTGAQQLAYNRRIAEIAHSFGLAVGLKNDLGQLSKLVNWYDFAVNEQCFQYTECNKYTNTFIAQDKAVFGVEYKGDPTKFCPKANAMNLSFAFKKLSLKAYRVGCEDY